MMRRFVVMTAAIAMMLPAVAAANPRETLSMAAFATSDRATALQQVNAAEAEAKGMLAKNPRDRDASLYRAMAIGYRARLTKSRADALTAGKMFGILAAADPRDPQAQALVAGWNLDSIDQLGGMVAGMALGAKRAPGVAALDRAVALGRNQAMFPALGALMRIRLDPADIATATQLADAATKTPAPTALDRVMQKSAAALLVPLRAGDGKRAQALARQLLPFGRVK